MQALYLIDPLVAKDVFKAEEKKGEPLYCEFDDKLTNIM